MGAVGISVRKMSNRLGDGLFLTHTDLTRPDHQRYQRMGDWARIISPK